VYFSKLGDDSALLQDGKNVDLDPSVAEKFKVVTCMSTSCNEERKKFGMDSLATFGAFFSRSKEGNAPSVRVEEGPCLGGCKFAPCVAIEHDDFIGNVALEGMTESEFSDRV
jgi:NADH:ubiquinone oxidoreductase subunit E